MAWFCKYDCVAAIMIIISFFYRFKKLRGGLKKDWQSQRLLYGYHSFLIQHRCSFCIIDYHQVWFDFLSSAFMSQLLWCVIIFIACIGLISFHLYLLTNQFQVWENTAGSLICWLLTWKNSLHFSLYSISQFNDRLFFISAQHLAYKHSLKPISFGLHFMLNGHVLILTKVWNKVALRTLLKNHNAFLGWQFGLWEAFGQRKDFSHFQIFWFFDLVTYFCKTILIYWEFEVSFF